MWSPECRHSQHHTMEQSQSTEWGSRLYCYHMCGHSPLEDEDINQENLELPSPSESSGSLAYTVPGSIPIVDVSKVENPKVVFVHYL